MATRRRSAESAGDAGQLEGLARVARLATEDLDLRPMLQRITDALVEMFDWELVALVRVDRDAGRFVCEAATSRVPTEVAPGYSRPFGSGVVGHVAATGQPLLLDDTSTFPDFVDTLGGARSELCVPIRHRGEVVAVLDLESPRPAAFRGQLALVEAIAGQVAGAIRFALVNRHLAELRDELESANVQLERLSLSDPLTGLANRRRLDAALDLEWRRLARARRPLSMLLIDVDAFKAYNDNLGHPRGDECLRRVAAYLAEGVHRAGDLVARYGGEEFAVLLGGTGVADAAAVAGRLRAGVEALALPHPAAPVGGVVTVSVGVAGWVPGVDGPCPEELVAAADRALHAARRAGRNRVMVSGFGVA